MHKSYSSSSRRSFGGRSRRPMQKSKRIAGTSMRVDQLINKVKEEANDQSTEQLVKHQFDDFLLDSRIKQNIKQKGYITPTPIQDQAIPVGLDGRDVIGIANTGTGKTAAFLLPILNKMLGDRSQKALILAPTRELALQIQDELRAYAKGFNLGVVLCIGGSNIMAQERMLRNPVHFVIGTPGRVIDLINRRYILPSKFQNIVLDEADRMVDMGFINDIRFVLEKLPAVRQSFFFTATLDRKVEELIGTFMKNPVKISVKMRATAANIEQNIVRVPGDTRGKLQVLIEHLVRPDFEKVLVFGRTKHGVEKITQAISDEGIKVDSIHGNKTQNYRQRALRKFKSGEVNVLVATDVAARGLDIKAVSHVINFDMPASYDDYIHRIGRTGRAEQKGIALTFVTH